MNINGRFIYAETDGHGSPTIVVEVGSGMAGTTDAGWQKLREELMKENTVFLYDRANQGQSSSAPVPRSLDDFAADLRAVLQGARVFPPYLLVGMSFGGMIITHYASQYPEGVSGILLLDPPHPEINLRTLAILPPESKDESTPLSAFRQIVWQEQYAPLDAEESEGLDFPASIAQAKASWNLRDIPLIVLTAGIDEWEEGFPTEIAQAYQAIWMECQKAYAALSPGQSIS